MCSSDLSTLCHSWQKGEVVLDMRVVTFKGRVSFWIIVLGECCLFFFLRDVVRILCIFSFLSFIDTLFLYIRSCDHFYSYIVLIFFISWCMFLSPTHTCVVSFLPLCTCFLCLYAIYYFCFTQRCLDEFCLKCFRNTGCRSLLAINSFLAKFFKSLC